MTKGTELKNSVLKLFELLGGQFTLRLLSTVVQIASISRVISKSSSKETLIWILNSTDIRRTAGS